MHRLRITGAGSPWRGEIEGASLGAGISFILTSLREGESGPALHRHPYDETFFVRAGRVAFSDGTMTLEAQAGDVVVVPSGTPHSFSALGGDVEMLDIHASARFSTEWLQAD